LIFPYACVTIVEAAFIELTVRRPTFIDDILAAFIIEDCNDAITPVLKDDVVMICVDIALIK
jgi:hypothetical protein